MVFNRRAIILIGVLTLVLSRVEASAEIMFEGYSIVRIGSTAVGYVVQRYEFNNKTKQFTSTYFLKTNDQGNNITESLKAVANDKFQPISYQYTTKVGDSLKMIDAKFAKEQMTATISDGKTTQTQKASVKKGSFLASFLGYMMLQNGYKVDKKFTYAAIAEEDGSTYTGEAHIASEQDMKGHKVFRILNKFKGSDFVSFVTPKGEVIGTSSPLQNISTELVASAAEATKGFIVPSDTLKLLFGSVPTGTTNILAGKTGSTLPVAEPSAPSSTPVDAKKSATLKPTPVEIKPPPKVVHPNEPSIPGEPKGN